MRLKVLALSRPTIRSAHSNTSSGLAVDPFAQLLVGDALRRSIYLAFGAVLLVLIACAHVANLVLAKGATRRRWPSEPLGGRAAAV